MKTPVFEIPQSKENSSLWNHYQSLTMPYGAFAEIIEPVLKILAQRGDTILKPAAALFAASHGVTQKNEVSAYPPTVTAQMVANFIGGGAAMSVLAKRRHMPLWVVDVGVEGLVTPPNGSHSTGVHFVQTGLYQKFGLSKSIEEEPALSQENFQEAWQAGVSTVDHLINTCDPNLLIFGEMGIGNSTLAAALACECLKKNPADVVGTGTGLDPKALKSKIEVVQKALQRHWSQFGKECPIEDLLRSLGGAEIVAMAGAAWRAASRQIHVLMDGAICTAALCPLVIKYHQISQWFIPSHLSPEPMHKLLIEFLGVKPILNAGLRLGEGSGAAVVLGIFQDAQSLLKEMATFETANVENKL